MRVSKWGNSLAVRLPATVVEALDLKAGDNIDLTIADRDKFGVVKADTRQELVERLHQFHGLLPADFKFDREEANAR